MPTAPAIVVQLPERLRRAVRRRRTRPPGPRLHTLRILFGRREGGVNGPLPFLEYLQRNYGDVVALRFGLTRIYALFDPHAIEELLVGHQKKLIRDKMSTELAFMLGEGMLTSEGEPWRRQRKMAAPSFTRKHISSYADAMVGAAHRELDTWHEGGRRDVHADMMRMTLDIVAETLFGGVGGGSERKVGAALEVAMTEFDRRANTWRRVIPRGWPTPAFRRIQAVVKDVDEVLHGAIAARRADGTPGDDLLWRLLEARDEDGRPLDDRGLRDAVATLFLAGHETTALTLAYALWLLAREPYVQEQLFAEVDAVLGDRPARVEDLPELRWVDAIVRESMRLYPPAWAIGRETLEDVAVGDYVFEKGSQVLIPQWIVHRDPRWFPDPLGFVPERWFQERTKKLPKFAYFPFGGGPRTCIGNHFAQMEAVLALASIAQRYAMEPVGPERLDLLASVTLRPVGGVEVRMRPRR